MKHEICQVETSDEGIEATKRCYSQRTVEERDTLNWRDNDYVYMLLFIISVLNSVEITSRGEAHKP